MPTHSTIRVDQLLEAVRRVLAEVVERYGAEPALPDDLYWSIPVGRAFALPSPPGEPTVGQVSDDVQSVRQFLERPVDEPVLIWHELAHISGVLRAIEHLDRPSA